MSEEERYEHYREEYYRYQSLHAQNVIEQDKAILSLSVALLAAIAAFGRDIILANKTLGIITIIFLALTIIQVLAGYYFSNIFFDAAKQKITENYNKSIENIGEGLDSIVTGKINSTLNITAFIFFGFSIAFFMALVIIFIGGLK